MIALSKNVYIDQLDQIVVKYNNKYHRTIKMKSTDVNVDTYINFDVGKNHKNSEFKVREHVRISKYEIIFAKGYTRNWSDEVFVVKNVNNTVPSVYVI